LVAVLVLAGAVTLGVATHRENTTAPYNPAACSRANLATGFDATADAPFHVLSVVKYQCVGNWAYFWANAGINHKQYFSITDLSRYLPSRQTWFPSNRAVYCFPHRLPRAVYLGACFSN